MKLVSLFAGIGGFDLAFQRAGFEIVAHVEIDPHCRKLLAAKFPSAQTFSDVRECGANNLPPCDVLTFGFPCQDLSVAGKRTGLAGNRSGLFYEATRIAYELKPAYLVWENVPGLLSSNKGHDFLAVLSEIRRIGYHGAWRTFDAQYFGLAQRRRRVFGMFAREHIGAECCAEILSFREGVRGHPAPRRETRQEVAGTLGGSSQKGGFRTTDLDNNGAFIPILEAGARTGKSTDDPRAGIGIGQPGDPMFTLQSGKQHAVCSTVSAKWSKGTGGPAGDECGNLIAFPQNLSATQHAATANLSTNLQAKNPTAVAFAQNTRDEVRELGGNIAGALGSQPGMKQQTYLCIRTANTGANGHGISADKSHTLDGANGQAVVFEHGSIARHLVPRGEREQCSTLRSKMGDNQPAVRIGSCVRRLTPRECERLQGFPDDWTAGFSDSTRYKMLGNAVAVPVVEWIAKRI